jgi:succinoglycan biosynthesis protein ExoA
VDGESDDDTVDVSVRIAKEVDISVRVIANPDRTIPHALNRGLSVADGQILVRLDAHAEFRPRYVERCVELLATGQWSGVGGRKNSTARTAFGAAAAFAFGSRLGSGGSYYHLGSKQKVVEHVPFGAYPRYIVQSLGGWDERLPVNQDYEFDYRVRQAGGYLLFDPGIVLNWRGRESPGSLARQYFRYGRGKAAVVRKHPGSVRVRQVVAPTLVVSLLFCFALAVGRRKLWPIVVPLMVYTVVICGGAVGARRVGNRPSVVARVPVALACMHIPWGTGFLAGLLLRGPEDPFVDDPELSR